MSFSHIRPLSADYLDLIAAVEDTCSAPCDAVSGWRATRRPTDLAAARVYGLTPDPGVLEVNLPPTSKLGRSRRR